jgi:SAM-dependent methyltransferase
MPETRPSIGWRIRRAFRRARALFGSPELTKRFDAQIAELSKRIDESIMRQETNLQHLRSESHNQLADLRTLITRDSEQTQNSNNLLAELSATLNSRMNTLETLQAELRNILGDLNTSLNSRLNSVETLQAELRNMLIGLNNGLNARLNSLETYQFESRNLLSGLETGFESRMNKLETLEFELKNLITHVGTSTESRLNVIATQQSETKNLLQHVNTSFGSRLNSFEYEQLPAINTQIHELLATQFSLGGGLNAKNLQPHPAERYKPGKKSQWNKILEKAEREFGTVFPFWRARLGTMLQAFQKTKVGNAAWAGDVKSRVFHGFVNRYANGRILDVGCGIFGRPYYLSTYSSALISGLDPLEPEGALDFEFVRGISEYLPWPDDSFSTVISATSLDHCMSLDRSLSEVRRVLRPGGHFLLWIDSIPGAPAYEPDRSEFVPSDQFHLFHFDVVWFEPLLTKTFQIVDRIELRRTGYISVMYCLEQLAQRSAPSCS